MASQFKKGDTVRVKVLVPEGPVLKVRMDEEGNVQYLVSWTNGDRVEERWFDESMLTSAQ